MADELVPSTGSKYDSLLAELGYGDGLALWPITPELENPTWMYTAPQFKRDVVRKGAPMGPLTSLTVHFGLPQKYANVVWRDPEFAAWRTQYQQTYVADAVKKFQAVNTDPCMIKVEFGPSLNIMLFICREQHRNSELVYHHLATNGQIPWEWIDSDRYLSYMSRNPWAKKYVTIPVEKMKTFPVEPQGSLSMADVPDLLPVPEEHKMGWWDRLKNWWIGLWET